MRRTETEENRKLGEHKASGRNRKRGKRESIECELERGGNRGEDAAITRR